MSTSTRGSKRGSTASSSRGRIFRGSRPSSRADNTKGSSAEGPQANMSGMKTGRGKGDGQPQGSRGQGHPFYTGTRAENVPTSNPFSKGFNNRKAQSASPFGRPAMGNTSIDRSRDPRRNRGHQSENLLQPSVNGQDYMGRYEQLKRERTKQRTDAINNGLMADPDQPTSLNRAITPAGICTDMCPEFERVERIVQKMVDKSEKSLNPETGQSETAEARMIKRFRRSAAGYDEQLPSDIRTPNTLLQTLNYILRYVISDDECLGAVHKFVWDRTRSIRNDLSIQQLTQQQDVEIAVKCLERIARFHILSLHLLSNPANTEQFDHHQEREQLNNTLLSLLYYYDDNLGTIRFPNEDEFRAYYILFSIHDQRPDLETRVQKWPRELHRSPRIQVAMELFAAAGNAWEYQGVLDARRPNAIAQGFYSRFFNLLRSKSVSYLMACIAEIYFNQVRQTAIRSIWKAYCRQPLSQQHKNQEWTIDELMNVLCFDTEDETAQFCEDQGLHLATDPEGQTYLDWGNNPIDSIAFQPSSRQIFSRTLTESKRYGRTLAAVILGMNVSQALKHGMINKFLLRTDSESITHSSIEGAQESLFVSDDEVEPKQEHVQNLVPSSQNSPPTTQSIFSRPAEIVKHQASTNPFLKQLQETAAPSSQSPFPFSATASPFFPANSLESKPSQHASLGTPPAERSPFGTPKLDSQSPFPNAAFGSFASASESGFSHFPPSTTQNTTIFQPASSTKQSFGVPSAPEAVSFGLPSSQPDSLDGQQKTPLFASPLGNEAESTPALAQTAAQAFGIFSGPPISSSAATNTQKGRDIKPDFVSNQFLGTGGKETPKSLFSFSSEGTLPSTSANGDKPKPTLSQPSTWPQSGPSPFSTIGTSQIFNSPASSTTPQTSSPFSFSSNPSFNALSQFQSSSFNGPNLQAPGANFGSGLPSELTSGKKSSETFEQKEEPPTPRTDDQNGILENKKIEMEKNKLVKEETTKKEAARREFERVRKEKLEKEAARQEDERREKDLKEKKEAAEREAARKEKAIKQQEEEIQAARKEIEKRKKAEDKATAKEAARREAIEKEVIKRKALADSNEEESRSKSKVARLNPKQVLTVEELLALELSRQKTAPPKSRPERKSLIDEDELLFSAARMAGRELSQVGLFDGLVCQNQSTVSRPTTPSSFSSSIIARASEVGKSTDVEGPHTTVNGYTVALAPQTPLGLGRTLSRTEQRIRLTGARGLAYKPIDAKGKSTSSKRKGLFQ